MRSFAYGPACLMLAGVAAVLPTSVATADGIAWASWRGPQQDGTSLEADLPESWVVDGAGQRWSVELHGRGTPVIADGRVYALGYAGEGPDLQELLVCLDERDGALLWKRGFGDFLSDTIYSRYSIGAPTLDPETGNVYWLTTPGLLNCFSADGELLWQRSMMEEFGRLTFPNGRTGAPVVDDDRLIVHVITSSWGSDGPARDRFFGFDKRSGTLLWSCTPGTGPKDSSFSYPVLDWQGDRRVLYAGTGCGHVVCIDARTGAPVWRFPMSIGGVNSAVLLADDRLIAIHGRENLDTSSIGRMVGIRLGAEPAAGEPGPLVLDTGAELWRNDLGAFTSAPVLAGERVYVTVHTGDLCCVDAGTGEILWHEKLGPDQIHAGPAYGDGKLYVPMTNGSFYIIEPGDEGPRILTKVQLEGNCLGPPAIAGGRVYVHTTEKLYCFGREGGVTPPAALAAAPDATPGPASALQCTPAEMLLQPGDTVALSARAVDAAGAPLEQPAAVTWTMKPPLDVEAGDGRLAVAADAAPGGTLLTATSAAGTGTARLRVVPALPFTEDFDGIALTQTGSADGVAFGFPPSHWIGGRLKWDVREVDGSQVLAKTLDRALFQRTLSYFGDPAMSGYTMQVDIMSEGNRRSMSSAGVINQRYMIILKGNHQQIEISSNQERVKHAVPFRWRPGTWYRLVSRVDLLEDGSTLVRGKAWPRDEPEPGEWTIEFTHANGHASGAPGLFGFTPQSRFRVHVDNIEVMPNE